MLRYDAVPSQVRLLLDQLAPHPALAEFSLGGGTSLALRFGHRLSVDLDFFTTRPFSPENLFGKLALENSTILSLSENSLTADADGVKIDMLRHAYPMLAETESVDGVMLVSLPDIAAMKLNAIANRGSKKDFFDLAELLKHLKITELIGFFTRKYVSSDPFTLIRSMAWFEDADAEPDPVSLNGEDWNGVKNLVGLAIRSL